MTLSCDNNTIYVHLTNLISVHLLCRYNIFVHKFFFTKFCVLAIGCISTLFPFSNLSNLIIRRVQPWTYKIHTMHEKIVWMRERKLHMIFSNTTEIPISVKQMGTISIQLRGIAIDTLEYTKQRLVKHNLLI
jgi:hypothetical protein